MKKLEGFTVIELLIAAAIGLISLGVLYGFYQAELKTYQFNKKRMEVIDELWLTMDKIEKEVREGKEFKSCAEFPLSIPPDSLVFATNDTATIAFFTSGDTALYRMVSTSLSAQTIAVGVAISAVTSPSGSCQISLTKNWTYRGMNKEESISSQIHLRNWGR